MRIVHFGHACVLLETGSERILIDPGTYSTGFEDERELSAVLVTHQHFDHLDVERLPKVLEANPDAKLIADPGSAPEIEKLGLPFDVANVGDAFAVGDTSIKAVGGEHAVIHADIPRIVNLGYVIDTADGTVYHPGDSFHVPDEEVATLFVPVSAPWLKLAEAIDFARAVHPERAFALHDSLLVDVAQQMVTGHMSRLSGTQYSRLEPGTAI